MLKLDTYLIIDIIIIITSIIHLIIILLLNDYFNNNTYPTILFNSKFNKFIIDIILSFLFKLTKFFEKLRYKGNDVKLINIGEHSRLKIFTYSNDGLLSHKNALRSIYNDLMSNTEFTNFGVKKVIIITAIIDNSTRR